MESAKASCSHCAASASSLAESQEKLALVETVVCEACDKCGNPIYNGELSVPANSLDGRSFHQRCHIELLGKSLAEKEEEIARLQEPFSGPILDEFHRIMTIHGIASRTQLELTGDLVSFMVRVYREHQKKELEKKPQYLDRFDRWIGPMRDAAKTYGYALAVHGSLDRDIDLVAVQWTESAADAETLIEALRAACDGFIVVGTDGQGVMYPVAKPHGRWGYKIVPGDGKTYFDISVVSPSALTDQRLALERIVTELREKLTQIEWHCPCGARPESPRTHPHVGGCPVADALDIADRLEARCRE